MCQDVAGLAREWFDGVWNRPDQNRRSAMVAH